VLNADKSLKGVFTDGDLRRLMGTKGEAIMTMSLSDLVYGTAKSIEASAMLNEANELFKSTEVDTLLVTDNGTPVGMLDIQDLAG
jgi:signal-transduction protein with cAMP-binding, CBS, and nucleotidyltransferase domain